jgi:hypothetical protein
MNSLPPPWVLREQQLRQEMGEFSYSMLPRSLQALTSREEYVRRYVEINFEPITWTTTDGTGGA